MRINAGNVPEPDELYGREHLLEYLWEQLASHNLMLIAPRRFGKTGMMRHVLKKPRDGFLPLYFDLEDVDAPEEFCLRVLRAVLDQAPLRKLLNETKRLPMRLQEWIQGSVKEAEFAGASLKLRELISEGWQRPARRLFLALEKSDARIVFIFDELQDMLIRLQSIDPTLALEFVEWFRAVRLQQKDTLRRHRFIIGGSIGIDVVLRKLECAHRINDFERLYVEPLARPDARRLFRDLAEGRLEVDDDLIDEALDLLGSDVPYFIQLFMSQLAQLPGTHRRPLSSQQLHKVYSTRLLGPTCRSYFDHYRRRLARRDKAVEAAAMKILKIVAQRERVSQSELFEVYRRTRKKMASDIEFNEIMADLECEWYLQIDNTTNEYRFYVGVIRDWWRRWYPDVGRPSAAANERRHREQ